MIVRRVLRLGSFLLLPLSGAAAQSFDHSAFTEVLREHVSERGVDYTRLKSGRDRLDAYVAHIGSVSAEDFAGWNRNEQIAYLLNAYNALVLRTVIDHYPIRRSLRPAALVRPANSVWQINGFFDEIEHQVAGAKVTLDAIEHSWLRPRYAEPRIHFALVCAAYSCPPLRTEAYAADRLDEQLNEQARRFLADPQRNRFDRAGRRLMLSEIFKWFAQDFGASNRDLPTFVARYVDDATAAWLRTGDYRLNYVDYDWTLNDVAAR